MAKLTTIETIVTTMPPVKSTKGLAVKKFIGWKFKGYSLSNKFASSSLFFFPPKTKPRTMAVRAMHRNAKKIIIAVPIPQLASGKIEFVIMIKFSCY